MTEPKRCIWCGKALPKRRRKYCSDECSGQYFINKIAPLWWVNARKIALKQSNNTCQKCGSSERLEVHHRKKLIGGYHNNLLNEQDNLRVLCRDCHEKEHHPTISISENQLRFWEANR